MNSKSIKVKIAEGEDRPSTAGGETFPKGDFISEAKSRVGNTPVAGMCEGQKDVKNRSATLIISDVLRFIKANTVSIFDGTTRIVESLIWPFVARLSLRTTWFSNREYIRFKQSMLKTARIINKYHSNDDRDQTFCKYWLDFYLCKTFRDRDLPIKEDWIKDQLFTGWCRTFVLRRIARQDISFIYSIQKGSKKMWNRLGEVKEKIALEKHMERISKDHGPLSEEMKCEIEIVSSYIFRDIDKMVCSKFIPSGSACLQAPRKNGGALSLTDQFELNLNDLESKIIGKLPSLTIQIEKWRREQYDKLCKNTFPINSSSFVRTTTFNGESTECEINFSLASSERSAVELDGELNGTIIESFFGVNDVRVVAVPEPGKFRVLTVGEGKIYTLLQPLQGNMLTCWKRSIYSTMKDECLLERVQALSDNINKVGLRDFKYFRSVDFESATDLAKKSASLAALTGLVGHRLFLLALISFFPGIAYYNKKLFGRETSVLQCEGQLMGHPLSFPLLCILNLAAYSITVRRYSKAFQLSEVERSALMNNVIINGDDMLFKCNTIFSKMFTESAKEVGFKVSVGKDYLSENCCMINSQIFKMSESGQFSRYGYLNLKLITGSCLKTGDSMATPVQISRSVNDMVSRSPWTACIIPRVFDRWKKDWLGNFQPNWYLPVHLGGFGVDYRFAPSNMRISRDQRFMASHYLSDPSMALYKLKNITIETAKFANSVANWRIVPNSDYLKYSEEEELSFTEGDEWLARLAYLSRISQKRNVPVSEKVFISKFRTKYDSKPLDDDGFEKFWNAKVYAYKLPYCPALQAIKIPIHPPRNLFPVNHPCFRLFHWCLSNEELGFASMFMGRGDVENRSWTHNMQQEVLPLLV